MSNIAIVFAGGVGARMGATIPKQFLSIYGKPIIIHTLEKFQYNDNIDKIYVSCTEDWIDTLCKLTKKFNITKLSPSAIIPGGTTGQDSIYNAIELASTENDLESVVLIHDGVRPVIDDLIIDANICAAQESGSAVTCASMTETPVVSMDGDVVTRVHNRAEMYIAKAPQSFILGEILEVHRKERSVNPSYSGIVDSCDLMMKYGHQSSIVPCGHSNIKVTTPDDYIDLVARLSSEDYRMFLSM